MSVQDNKESTRHGSNREGRTPELDTGEWQALWTLVTRVGHSLGADDADVQDLAQDVLTKLHKERRHVVNRVAWTKRVLRNLLYQQRKRRARRAQIHSQATRQSDSEKSPTGEWSAVVDVNRILAETPPTSRKLLELYERGYTHAEIAARLGCELHQVGPRIRSALKTARRRAIQRS